MDNIAPSIDSIASLASNGLAGICIALILNNGLLAFFLFKAYAQHAVIFSTKMKENSDAFIEVAKALVGLKDVIDEVRRVK